MGRHRRNSLFVFVTLIAILIPASTGLAIDLPMDFIERIFGPTDINGVVGNSAMAAALSAKGNLTVLRWPSPGYCDQMGYLTISRDLERMGARPNAGSFAGLYLVDRDGVGTMTWIVDDEWKRSQSYLGDDSDVLVTVYVSDSFGMEVTERTFVLPGRDVLVRNFRVAGRQGSRVVGARFFYFENFDPCLRIIPELPIADWALDGLNDYALLYTRLRDAIVHFRPGRIPDEAVVGAGGQVAIDSLAEGLDRRFGNGVYIALGADRQSAGHQCGRQDARVGFLPWRPQDPYYDSRDGSLRGRSIYTGDGAGALAWDLGPGGVGEVTVYIAAAGRARAALDLLEEARAEDLEVHLTETEAWWADWIGRARLPDTEDPAILRISKRALISVRNGYDASTGAIVASLSTQPPYAQDWPRDGSFVNYALDLAGYADMVTAHNFFYADSQRKRSGLARPQGTWSMCHYSEGTEAAPAVAFEIDGVGLAAWSMWEHARFITDPAERASYLETIYPSIRLAAEAIVRCRDPRNGLECRYFSEAALGFVQDLYGAAAERLGLRSAVEAGEAVGEDAGLLGQWRARLDELESAIFTEFDDYYVWWPLPVLAYDDPRMREYAEAIYLDEIVPVMAGERGGTYLGLSTITMSHIWAGDEEMLDRVRETLDFLVKDVPTRWTGHYGEVYLPVEGEGGERVFECRTGVPHLMQACLTYITAMALYGPWR